MQFEFYVLNYNTNGNKVEMFNVFNNIRVQEWTEKAVRKYLRTPKRFMSEPYNKNEEILYGFDALVEEIRRTIAWQENGRRQYEISVGDAFTTDCTKLEKWDCYDQCKPNMRMIAYEVIRQYKEQLKVKEDN